MRISLSSLVAVTFSIFSTTTYAAAAGLYGQGPAILDRQSRPQDQSVPLSCRKSPAILVFGDIRNFAAATSFCSRYIASATTVTSVKTIAHAHHTTPCSETATPTAGRLPSESEEPAVSQVDLSEAPGGADRKKPAEVSAACSCLIQRPARITVTITSATYVHAPAATKPTGKVLVQQQAEKAGAGFADFRKQILA